MSDEIIKKYFIKDEELTSINQDKLGAKDVVNNIISIIDTTKPPFAISVNGKSGIGKSSIINMVAEKYENLPEEYNVKKINIWKNETTLKQILDENCVQSVQYVANINNNAVLNNADIANNVQSTAISSDANAQKSVDSETEKQNLIDDYYNSDAYIEEDKKEDLKDQRKSAVKGIFSVVKFVLTFLICFLITTLIFIFMEYMGNKSIYSNDVFFVENTYLNYRENFLMIMIFAFGLTAIAYIVQTLMIATKKSVAEKKNSENNIKGTSLNINNDAQIMGIKQNNIAQNATIINKQIINSQIIDSLRKNIIIIEDIDKLTVAKMLKTLDDIKHCSEYINCIILVSIDDKILEKAIKVRNQMKNGANYRPLKLERILDKVFQFKFDVPHFSNTDIKDYAVNLVEQEASDFIEEYSDLATFEKTIRNVLVYRNVVTPRHAKKLINNYIHNKLLIAKRIESGKIDDKILNSKDFECQLAKISVLQSDFEKFYNTLFIDFDYLDDITKYYCMEPDDLRNAWNDIDDDLKPFFTNKSRPLVYFLRQTRNYQIENMPTLMYATKIKSEKLFKGKNINSYILGEENLTELTSQEILELTEEFDNKQDKKEFITNNFDNLLEVYKNNPSDKEYFENLNTLINTNKDYISESEYTKYLEIVADNYNYYPDNALNLFSNLEIEIPANIMNVLIRRISESISKENYDKSFEFLKENSDPFYEEGGNISEYVKFLVNNISLATEPNAVIQELDDNFTRISKVYELNQNIKGLDNLDYDKAYAFMAKCLDNGDVYRMSEVINQILSDVNSIDDCLKIEEKLSNYKLTDVIECDVDDISMAEEENTPDENFDSEEYKKAVENAELIKGNYTLLENLVELCSIKQEELNSVDVMKIIEKALVEGAEEEYILGIYDLLNKFDRGYFYEFRRNFNEIIYSNFHKSESDKIKKAALDCTRYFRNTRLFLTKITDEEKEFYKAN